MVGDERSRICGDCRLRVYDFGQLTEAEALALLAMGRVVLTGVPVRCVCGTVVGATMERESIGRWLSRVLPSMFEREPFLGCPIF